MFILAPFYYGVEKILLFKLYIYFLLPAKANLEQIGEGNEKSTLLGLKQAQLGGLVDGSVLAADKSPITGVQAGALEGVLGLVGGLLPS